MSEPPPGDASGQQDSGQYPARAPYQGQPYQGQRPYGPPGGQQPYPGPRHSYGLQPALARPGPLDDATVARITGVHQDQAGGLMPFQDPVGRWNAVPGLTPAQRAAAREYEAASGQLRWLKARVLAAAGQLQPVTMEALLARSGLRSGGAAWHTG